MASDISYRRLSKKDVPMVTEFIDEHYKSRSSFEVNMGPDNIDTAYFERIRPFVEQGNSFGAFDGNNVLCGTLMNVEHDEEDEQRYKSTWTEPGQKITRIFDALTDGKLNEVLGTDKYWEVKFACVSPKHAGKRIFLDLARKSIELAKKKGIEKMIAYSSYDGYAGTASIGFKPIRRIKFADFVDPVTGKKEFEKFKYPNSSVSLHVLDLTEKQSQTVENPLPKL